MNKCYMGIDLGTSSVKVLCKYADGKTQKAKALYKDNTPKGWCNAVADALSQIDASQCTAIGLTSQVGTYITEDNTHLSWNSSAGGAELGEIKAKYSRQKFIEEISMPHPDIISYPLPRLKYIQKLKGDNVKVCQPKEYIGKMLTGNLKTDKFSWRGLANNETGKYSKLFLEEAGNPYLPELADCTSLLGFVCDDICKKTNIPKNTPVYVGLNDFYASLVGMNIFTPGDMFDITGTSEHLGIICKSLNCDTKMISGPYIENFVHYGVTASSGASLDFGIKNFGFDGLTVTDDLIKSSPIFTPYLNGERAPIFDSNATGMFYGINSVCTNKNLAYSVLEGVVFSIYHIYESLGKPKCEKLTVSGGAAKSDILNSLKAEMFGIPLHTLDESDTSALGAAIVAAAGTGDFKNINEASRHFCRLNETIKPNGKYADLLHKRYEIYKELYPTLKNLNHKLREVHI